MKVVVIRNLVTPFLLVLTLASAACSGHFDLEPADVYLEVMAAMPSDGYGYDTLCKTEKRHYPQAYALISSAETHRYIATGDSQALTRALENADWLIENGDLDNDGLVGFGVPVAWDAFGDGTTNHAHTSYAITVALCTKALLDAFDAIAVYHTGHVTDYNFILRQAKYLEMAISALDSFIESNAYERYPNCTATFWYSLQPEDSYPTMNIQAMLAGALQRASTYPIADATRVIYAELADELVRYTLNQRMDLDDAWVWNYLSDEVRPDLFKPRLNDSCHAAYIVDGLMTYKVYGGKLAVEIDDDKLLGGLGMFLDRGKMWELPDRDMPPRLWGVGYVLYSMSIYFDAIPLADSVYDYATDNLWLGGHFGFREGDDSGYVRHSAHMLLGLSTYAFRLP